jgi:two-component system alkaline phosphatase synthesis response regulator PhoP
VHIRKLREKLGDDYFKTIKGVGYKFEAWLGLRLELHEV